jgi:quercetin dioxygenase-like cupin family protein
VIDVSSGRSFDALGAPVRRLIHPKTVGSDQLGVSICDMPPGSRVRRHRHIYEEAYFVISGAGRMYLEGEPGDIELVPGLLVYVAPGRVHGQVNDGAEQLRILCSMSPPPVEGEMPELMDEAEA